MSTNGILSSPATNGSPRGILDSTFSFLPVKLSQVSPTTPHAHCHHAPGQAGSQLFWGDGYCGLLKSHPLNPDSRTIFLTPTCSGHDPHHLQGRWKVLNPALGAHKAPRGEDPPSPPRSPSGQPLQPGNWDADVSRLSLSLTVTRSRHMPRLRGPAPLAGGWCERACSAGHHAGLSSRTLLPRATRHRKWGGPLSAPDPSHCTSPRP